MSIVPVWTLILGAAVFFYVVLDGFDLGIGSLYNFASTRAERRSAMMNAIAPIWDGNETWLVLGGTGLMAAFPLAFSIILPAVYFPILMMLLSLVFRGVAFEFQYRDIEHRHVWDYAFALGSALGTFAQGIVLGAFIQGFQVEGRAFRGRRAGLLHAFLPVHGAGSHVRLLASGRLLAGPEDRRRASGKSAALGQDRVSCHIHRDRGGKLVDAPGGFRYRAPLVLMAEYPVPVAGPAGKRAYRMAMVARGGEEIGNNAISLCDPALLTFLSGNRHQPIPNDRAPSFLVGCRRLRIASTQIFLGRGQRCSCFPSSLVYTGWSYWVFRGKVKRGDIGLSLSHGREDPRLITGAAKRLGRAIALDLAGGGAGPSRLHYSTGRHARRGESAAGRYSAPRAARCADHGRFRQRGRNREI